MGEGAMPSDIGSGDIVAVRSGHQDHAGRIGRVAEARSRFDDGVDLVLDLAGCGQVTVDATEVETDWGRAILPEIRDMDEALRRGTLLVGLVTIRDVLHHGDAAIDAAGLNPWCVNEGRATGDERLSPFWLHHASERARDIIARLDGGEVPEGISGDLGDISEAARRAARLASIPTIGQVFDAGDACIEASGLDVWCMRDGRATREDRVGSNGAWRLDHAAERAAAIQSDIAATVAPGSPAP